MRQGFGFVIAGILVGASGLAVGGWWALGHPIPDFVAHHFRLAA